MALDANRIDATDVEELIPTEEIGTFIIHSNFAPTTAQAVGWMAAGKGSIARRFPRTAAFSVPAGTKSEGDAFTVANNTTAENTVTPGLIGFGFQITDTAARGSVVGLAPMEIVEAINGLNDRIDSDFHSSSTSATVITGADTDTMDVNNLLAGISAYRAQNIRSSNGLVAVVLGSDAGADFMQDLGSSGAAILGNADLANIFGAESGFMGSFGRTQIFETSNVTTTGAGRSNYITPIGMENSGIAMVQTEAPNIRVTRGDTMELAAGTQYVARAWVGLGLTSTGRIVELLGRD